MAVCLKTTIPEEQKLDVLRWYSLNIIAYIVFYHAKGISLNYLFLVNNQESHQYLMSKWLYIRTWWPQITLFQL